MAATRTAEGGAEQAAEYGALRMARDAAPGWFTVSPFRDRRFPAALAILFFYGSVLGVLHYFYKIGAISIHMKTFHGIALYGCFFIGGLWLSGKLKPWHAVLIMAMAVISQAWTFAFKFNPMIASLAVFFPGTLIFWWVWLEPETMAAIGFRKKFFFKDLALSITLAAVPIIYIVLLLKAYGYSINIPDPWTNIAHFAVTWPQSTMLFCFVFAIWNKMKDKGLSTFGHLTILFVTVFCDLVPLCAAQVLSGSTRIGMGLAGLFGGALMYGLFMLTTFGRFKNTLPAGILGATTMEFLIIFGIT